MPTYELTLTKISVAKHELDFREFQKLRGVKMEIRQNIYTCRKLWITCRLASYTAQTRKAQSIYPSNLKENGVGDCEIQHPLRPPRRRLWPSSGFQAYLCFLRPSRRGRSVRIPFLYFYCYRFSFPWLCISFLLFIFSP